MGGPVETVFLITCWSTTAIFTAMTIKNLLTIRRYRSEIKRLRSGR